jgi:Glycine/serine hydroxymethyltransferase
LHELGFKVLAEKNGFTRSHTILVNVVDKGGGKYVAEKLEANNIILNKNMIPGDSNKRSQDPSGIRIGTQEVTRLGMGKSEMSYIAELINNALKGKDVREEVKELKSQFSKIKYCYGDHKAYEYIKLF